MEVIKLGSGVTLICTQETKRKYEEEKATQERLNRISKWLREPKNFNDKEYGEIQKGYWEELEEIYMNYGYEDTEEENEDTKEEDFEEYYKKVV